MASIVRPLAAGAALAVVSITLAHEIAVADWTGRLPLLDSAANSVSGEASDDVYGPMPGPAARTFEVAAQPEASDLEISDSPLVGADANSPGADGHVVPSNPVRVIDFATNVAGLPVAAPDPVKSVEPALADTAPAVPDGLTPAIDGDASEPVEVALIDMKPVGVIHFDEGDAPIDLTAPIPAPRENRPILVPVPVPVDATIVAARSISLDPLVNESADGSWPRRLDQVNARAELENTVVQGVEPVLPYLVGWIQIDNGYGARPVPRRNIGR
ncbi:MAG: hypothetical protein H6873_11645 [Hyphomicrobiaceae bacterium]|nr:hypothetical protein [Hyphomicrobiaceae bacterium]